MSDHEPGCIIEYPTCLCISCQHDHDDCCDDHADKVILTGPNICCVVKCPDYLKEEASDHA